MNSINKKESKYHTVSFKICKHYLLRMVNILFYFASMFKSMGELDSSRPSYVYVAAVTFLCHGEN